MTSLSEGLIEDENGWKKRLDKLEERFNWILAQENVQDSAGWIASRFQNQMLALACCMSVLLGFICAGFYKIDSPMPLQQNVLFKVIASAMLSIIGFSIFAMHRYVEHLLTNDASDAWSPAILVFCHCACVLLRQIFANTRHRWSMWTTQWASL